MRGRKPKSNVLRILQGNPRQKRLAPNPQPKATLPKCLRHLHGEAREAWKKLAPKLFALGLLTELDVTALSALCVTWALWHEAEQKLASEGLVVTGPRGPRPSPWIAIASRAARDMQALAAEFGLSPLSRQRIHVVPPAPPDPFQELLDGA
jgi:P27 family predicted phage terminase small subunit